MEPRLCGQAHHYRQLIEVHGHQVPSSTTPLPPLPPHPNPHASHPPKPTFIVLIPQTSHPHPTLTAVHRTATPLHLQLYPPQLHLLPKVNPPLVGFSGNALKGPGPQHYSKNTHVNPSLYTFGSKPTQRGGRGQRGNQPWPVLKLASSGTAWKNMGVHAAGVSWLFDAVQDER